jgi:hypothetical protein
MNLTEAIATFRLLAEAGKTDAIPSNGKAMLDKILPKKIKKVLGLSVKFAPGAHSSELWPDGKRYMARLLDSEGTKLQFEVRHAHGQWRLSIGRVSGHGASPSSPVSIAKSTGQTVALALNSMKTSKLPNLVKEPKPQKTPPSAATLASAPAATGVYKGKKYQVLGYKNGGTHVELAWFSDKTKSFTVYASKVQITGSGVIPQSSTTGHQPIPRWFRFSTTLVKGHALKNRAVDVTQVVAPNGKNISGAKRTQRTGGWRDRILMKFNKLSGLHARTFGDTKTKHKVDPTTSDWEAIKDKINATGKAEAYFAVPKGWHQTALIVQVA